MKRTADSRLTPLLNITGEGVRRAREEAGCRQKQLSIKPETRAVSVCRGSLSRAEHGSRIVADLALQAVSEVLNDPMERLRLSKKPRSAREGQNPLEFPSCPAACTVGTGGFLRRKIPFSSAKIVSLQFLRPEI